MNEDQWEILIAMEAGREEEIDWNAEHDAEQDERDRYDPARGG